MTTSFTHSKLQLVHVILAGLLAISRPSWGFELATHGQMTLSAYQITGLGSSPEAFRRLGLEGWIFSASTSGRPLESSYILQFGGDGAAEGHLQGRFGDGALHDHEAGAYRGSGG